MAGIEDMDGRPTLAPDARLRALICVTNATCTTSVRLPQALAEAGFSVTVMAPVDHLITFSSHLERTVAYAAGIDVATFHALLAETVADLGPHVVLPADDPALWLLHRLRLDPAAEQRAPALARVLATSLADAGWVLELERESSVSEHAAALGIPIPAQHVNPTVDQARAFAERHGFPILVKVDHSWGGHGIRRCPDLPSLCSALSWQPSTPFFHADRRRTVQALLTGDQIVVGYAAWRGEARALLPLVKVTASAGGGSCVVRRCDDGRVVEAARRLLRRFGCTGFGDVEFRVDEHDGVPRFLEINPRIVPSTAQGPLFGVDMCAALRDALAGIEAETRVSRAPLDRLVATFPGEWLRDPHSPYLRTAHHDVPWDDPRLLCETIRRAAASARCVGPP